MSDAVVQIEEFVSTIRRRNRCEIAVGLLMLVVFGHHAATDRMGSREFFGHLLLVVAIAFVIGIVLFAASTRGDLKSHPANDLAFWRAEILRHARLLRLVPYWYIAPFLPGFALLLCPVALLLIHPAVGIERAVAVAVLGVVMGVCVAVAWLNIRAAARLEEQARLL